MTTTENTGDILVRGDVVQIVPPRGPWTLSIAEVLNLSRRLTAATHLIATRPHCPDCENHL